MELWLELKYVGASDNLLALKGPETIGSSIRFDYGMFKRLNDKYLTELSDDGLWALNDDTSSGFGCYFDCHEIHLRIEGTVNESLTLYTGKHTSHGGCWEMKLNEHDEETVKTIASGTLYDDTPFKKFTLRV